MSFAPNRLPGWVVNRWQLSAIVIWLVIVVASCVRVLFFAHASPGTYPTFAEAGRNWLAGANLYPDHDDFHVYRYSPAVTPLFTHGAYCAGRGAHCRGR